MAEVAEQGVGEWRIREDPPTRGGPFAVRPVQLRGRDAPIRVRLAAGAAVGPSWKPCRPRLMVDDCGVFVAGAGSGGCGFDKVGGAREGEVEEFAD